MTMTWGHLPDHRHLPLLVALQIALARWAGPATVKFVAALGCTLGVCLVSYLAFAALALRLWRPRARP